MALFRYSARKLTGQLVEGQAAAASHAALSAQLSADGMVLVTAKPLGRNLFSSRARGVKLASLMAFVREFRALSGAGMPLATALERLETRKDDVVLSAAIAGTRKRVEQGKALDEAMAEAPSVFDPLFQATVRAGLATGQLERALDRLLTFLTMRNVLNRKVKRALTYPAFLLALLAVVLAILMLFVLPRFSDLYTEFGADLPWLTAALIRTVETAPIWVTLGFGGVIAGSVLMRLWLAVPAARLRFDRAKLAVPVIGPILRETGQIQIAFMQSMLLSSGMPLHEALRFARDSLSNHWQRAAVGRMEEAVGQGQSLTKALRAEKLYPELSVSLIEAGEQAGDLDRIFGEVAKLHEDRLEDRLNRTLALVEPGIMLLVGLVLGTVIIAVYLPIFGISTVIQ